MKKIGDWTLPFKPTADWLKSADLTFGNLETAILPGREILPGEFSFRADPKSISGLKLAGFDVLSIANNHVMNFGSTGLEQTKKYLAEQGIDYVGVNYDSVIKNVGAEKVAFLAYSDLSFKEPRLNQMMIEKMTANVKAVKAKADYVIVSMHSGIEYKDNPNQIQKDFAHAAIAAGANLIIGHHPHVIEPLEKYKDGYIIYSLGNFVFDQLWSEKTRLGQIAQIVFSEGQIKSVTLKDIKINTDYQPELTD